MATAARSDTNLVKEKDGVTAIPGTDWTLVDADVHDVHRRSVLDLDQDESWHIIDPTPSLREYVGLKKATFAVEAWNWAFGWLKRNDRGKETEKIKIKSPARHDTTEDERTHGVKILSGEIFSPALEQEIVEMFQHILAKAIEEIMEEVVLRNEEIFQKMLTDVIETAWIEIWEEESRMETIGNNTDTANDIAIEQMFRTTLETAYDEILDEEKLYEQCCDVSAKEAGNLVARMVAESLDSDSGDEDVAESRDQDDVKGEPNSESTLSKHERTMDEVEMFYDQTVDSNKHTDDEIISRARLYVQDIIIASLGILKEEQKESSDGGIKCTRATKTNTIDPVITGKFKTKELASGGGDSAHVKPKDNYTLESAYVPSRKAGTRGAIIIQNNKNGTKKVEMKTENIRNEIKAGYVENREAVDRKDIKIITKNIFGHEYNAGVYNVTLGNGMIPDKALHELSCAVEVTGKVCENAVEGVTETARKKHCKTENKTSHVDMIIDNEIRAADLDTLQTEVGASAVKVTCDEVMAAAEVDVQNVNEANEVIELSDNEIHTADVDVLQKTVPETSDKPGLGNEESLIDENSPVKENTGRWRNFRNRLSRLCFWRK